MQNTSNTSKLNGLESLQTIKTQKEQEIDKQLVTPLTKEQLHNLWAIQDLTEKKSKTIELLKSYVHMKTDYYIKIIKNTRSNERMDSIITDLFFKVEESCKAKNLRILQKNGMAPKDDEEDFEA